jgi:hypothetical protein
MIIPGTPEHATWQAEQLIKNKRASAKRARWAARIGMPFPRSATDLRPDPGEWDGEDPELG